MNDFRDYFVLFGIHSNLAGSMCYMFVSGSVCNQKVEEQRKVTFYSKHQCLKET